MCNQAAALIRGYSSRGYSATGQPETRRLGMLVSESLSCLVSFTQRELITDMNDQEWNLKFVAEVEKFPELFNYKLKCYSRKDITEKAWNEVAKAVKLSASECKEKWKNLRSVFVRHIKSAASGSGVNGKKPYYLSEAMKFTLPFIRTVGKPEGNLPEAANEPPSTPTASQQLSDDCSRNTCLTDEEEEDTTMATPLMTPPDVHISTHLIAKDNPPQSFKLVSSPRKRKRNTLTDVDKSFRDYMDTKKKKIASEMKDPEGRKMFLLSLLPEIEPLTEVQMRSFRRGVLRLIDDIRSDGFQIRLYPSSSHSSLHGDAASLHQESDMSSVDEQGQSTSQQYFVVHEALDSSNF